MRCAEKAAASFGFAKVTSDITELKKAEKALREREWELSKDTINRSASPLRILVIDDYVDGAESLALLLRTEGHEVHTSHTGAHALELVAEYQPNVVLMEIGLPGMDGYAIARRVRAMSPARGILLIAFTCFDDEAHRAKSREAGFDFHLLKPLNEAQLDQVLAAVVASGSSDQ